MGFDIPASIDQAAAFDQDQLLAIFRPLLETGIRLSLVELKLRKMSRFQISSLAKAIDFRTLERLSFIETRPCFNEFGEGFWQYLTELGGYVALRSLDTDYEFESLEAFIASFQGLEDLILCDPDKRWQNIHVSHPSLAPHFPTLKRVFLPRDVHGGRFMNPTEMALLVDNCPRLEEFGFAFCEYDMVRLLCLVLQFSALDVLVLSILCYSR